jgi:ferrochelatase
MSRYLAFPDPANPVRLAVLLVNLGTPDAPDVPAVRRYLAEFLADPRIVELPRWLWRLILHGYILRTRPSRSARAYRKVWTPAGSPLEVETRGLAAALQARLDPAATRIRVSHAMRYGRPSIPARLAELGGQGMQRLLVVPLFPQFSATTTASALDAVGLCFRQWRRPPEWRFVGDYHEDPLHIEALARQVERHWQEQGRAQSLLLSFHGIPLRYVRAGDPYRDQCEATAARLRDRLGLDASSLRIAFQSRVGREPWLAPYTDRLLAELPGQGVNSVDVLCPGFAVDCLETLEEIAIGGRNQFLAAGGLQFRYIDCLNSNDGQVDALEALVRRHAQGWPEFDQHAGAAHPPQGPA